jgi:hypothetical protein
MGKYIPAERLPEDKRITLIGNAVMELAVGRKAAFCVDDEPGKPERYIRKLLSRYPDLEVKEEFRGPTEGVYTVVVWKKGSTEASETHKEKS